MVAVLVHAALAGSSAQLKARQGGVLSVPALLVWHIREKGPPPREPSLGASQEGDLDPISCN